MDSLDSVTMMRFPLAWGGVRLFKSGQKGLPVQIPLSPIAKSTMDEESLYEFLSQGEKVPPLPLPFAPPFSSTLPLLIHVPEPIVLPM